MFLKLWVLFCIYFEIYNISNNSNENNFYLKFTNVMGKNNLK